MIRVVTREPLGSRSMNDRGDLQAAVLRREPDATRRDLLTAERCEWVMGFPPGR
jgi:hypothetical protein